MGPDSIREGVDGGFVEVVGYETTRLEGLDEFLGYSSTVSHCHPSVESNQVDRCVMPSGCDSVFV